MGGWRKALRAMLADRKGRSYTYDQAATVLEHLGFQCRSPRRSGGSHRKWCREIPAPGTLSGRRLIVIGLVERGSGPMQPEYVKQMIDTLEEHQLLTGLDL